MAEITRGELFSASRPKLSDEETYVAAKDGKVVLSFEALPVAGELPQIQFLAVKFALPNGTTPVLLFDRYAAEFLKTVINHFDEGDWKMTLLSPSGVKPH